MSTETDPAMNGGETGSDHAHWRELFHEVVDTGICTGCAACVLACPHGVLDITTGIFEPEQTGEGMGIDECSHGDRGCDVCTRACPRFRTWESEIDRSVFGRERKQGEVSGIYRSALQAWAQGPIHQVAQDGGLVTSLLIWAFETGRIDGAIMTRRPEGEPLGAEPFVATTADEVMGATGSTYSYASTPLALDEAAQLGLDRVAMVGVGCQTAAIGAARARGLNRLANRVVLTIGLLCSKTFTRDGQAAILSERGIDPTDVVKVDVKGRYLVSTIDGRRHEIPLKELYPHTRPGCQTCPDFSAEHADISAGGIGSSGWTLTLARTLRGEDWLEDAARAGVIALRSAEHDPEAMRLLAFLSRRSRERWPTTAEGASRRPGLLPLAD